MRRNIRLIPRTVIASLLVAIAGCGGQAEDQPGMNRRTLHIGGQLRMEGDTLLLTADGFPNALPVFGDIRDVALGPDGRTIILDPMGPTIIVLARSGEEEIRFGREGEGPGEFQPTGLTRLIVIGDTIVVPDILNQRVTLFDLEGQVLGSFPIDTQGELIVDWKSTADGKLVFRRRSEPQRIEAVDLSGSNTDTWGEGVKALTFKPIPVPLSPFPVWCLLPDRSLISGRSDDYTLALTDETGTSEVVIQGDLGSRPIDEDATTHVHELVRESVRRRFRTTADPEMMKRVIDNMVLPKEAPRISDVLCSESGEIWVQHALPVEEMDIEILRIGSGAAWGSNSWDVFDLDAGRWRPLGLPSNARLTRVTDDIVLGIVVDQMGRKQVARWRR